MKKNLSLINQQCKREHRKEAGWRRKDKIRPCSLICMCLPAMPSTSFWQLNNSVSMPSCFFAEGIAFHQRFGSMFCFRKPEYDFVITAKRIVYHAMKYGARVSFFRDSPVLCFHKKEEKKKRFVNRNFET
ncbi:hypothetical protein CDAR_286011 [Caerostris darwini]|uniref:Uncharacterized protein n=1 Tax=Caerostris darwini TaxID=1538125 RepID=A0AAV4N3L5_9ARAC|nr:hypothetical protein CDAR_286011 [Caerostris darwini]